MKYVFFDVECANCLNGEGKICSFGYVITDESFQVLKKKDILVDPNAQFLLGNVKTGAGIKLAYPLFRFRQAHTFPHYYKEIESVLSDPDSMCFGFAVFQDVSYVSYSCKRYQLPLIDFKFFDIQKMEKDLTGKKNNSGLDTLIEEFHLDSYTYHRSDDDALMTMEVFQALLKAHNMTVAEAIERFPSALNDTETLMKTLEEHRKEKAVKREHHEKVKNFFMEDDTKMDINICDSFFMKNSFFFDNKVLNDDIDFLLKNKELMKRKGALITRNPTLANVVVSSAGRKLRIEGLKEEVVYVPYDTFKKKLSKRGK